LRASRSLIFNISKRQSAGLRVRRVSGPISPRRVVGDAVRCLNVSASEQLSPEVDQRPAEV
jgi:hypothetical protein